MTGEPSSVVRPAPASCPQDAVSNWATAFKAAVAAGDDARAAALLKEAFTSESGREAALRLALRSAGDAGRIDLWLGAARDAALRFPEDAFANYVTGFMLQRQKLLREADPFLARAVELAPAVGDYVDAYAWNAFLRFDRPEAARRASLGEFAGRKEFLVEARREPAAFPLGPAALSLVVSALFLALALRLVGRAKQAT